MIRRPRGFTLLEMMFASAMGIVILAGALTIAVQLQKQAVFEEQTMIAQLTARAVKETLYNDLLRAGTGTGNSPITFADGDVRSPVTVLTEPDLSSANPYFPGDSSTFALPPSPYLPSDAIQLWWGDTEKMVLMDDCIGGSDYRIREGTSDTFCTAPNPDETLSGPALLVNPTLGFGCLLNVSSVSATSLQINANPGAAGFGSGTTTTGPCADPNDPAWTNRGWFTLQTRGAAYRVNWATGSPVLEYDPPVPPEVNWVPVSRDVERIKVRQAVIDLTQPAAEARWFPDPENGRTKAIDQCTVADAGPGGECEVLGLSTVPTTDQDLRIELERRVRDLEVTLTIRSQRYDPQLVVPGFPPGPDGFPQDGYKRRIISFRVNPRNFSYAGLQPTLGPPPTP